MNMINLHKQGVDPVSGRSIVENIIVNIFTIKTIEDSGFSTKEKTKINFIDDSHIYVINAKEDIMDLFNKQE